MLRVARVTDNSVFGQKGRVTVTEVTEILNRRRLVDFG